MIRADLRAVFVDTSILCNFLRVPGFDQDRDAVLSEYREFLEHDIDMLLPITSVIETGNHIAQSKGDRRATAQRFVAMLEMVAAGTAPWTPREITWDSNMIDALVQGVADDGMLAQLTRGVGAGDALILAERVDYCSRLKWPVSTVGIWTRDAGLFASS